jgi:erythrocyte band 7 integral membrane protein
MRLGKARSIRGPGTVFILPCIDKAITVDIRVNSNVLPAVNVITRDRGLVEFTAAVFSKVVDPMSSICAVQNREQVRFIFIIHS